MRAVGRWVRLTCAGAQGLRRDHAAALSAAQAAADRATKVCAVKRGACYEYVRCVCVCERERESVRARMGRTAWSMIDGAQAAESRVAEVEREATSARRAMNEVNPDPPSSVPLQTHLRAFFAASGEASGDGV
jgi:hypothetical protein